MNNSIATRLLLSVLGKVLCITLWFTTLFPDNKQFERFIEILTELTSVWEGETNKYLTVFSFIILFAWFWSFINKWSCINTRLVSGQKDGKNLFGHHLYLYINYHNTKWCLLDSVFMRKLSMWQRQGERHLLLLYGRTTWKKLITAEWAMHLPLLIHSKQFRVSEVAALNSTPE